VAEADYDAILAGLRTAGIRQGPGLGAGYNGQVEEAAKDRHVCCSDPRGAARRSSPRPDLHGQHIDYLC
jgi:hypothetical protein